jgi:hypothetical protein
MSLMFLLTLADGIHCAWFINPILCQCCCLEKGTTSINWDQLNTFLLKEIESSLQNNVLNKEQDAQ